MMLCVAMLVGSTFAWFTDSVTSGKNRIVAGNLDVELEYAKTDKDGVLGEWTKVEETTNIFDEAALWEPGYTEVVYLRVKNVGSLALKYKLGINVADKEIGYTENGDKIDLANFIKFGVVANDGLDVPTYTDRAEAVADAEPNATLLSTAYTSEEGHLAANTDSNTMALVVYMPTTVGNEANHGTGKAQPSITLGLNLVATQDTVESDSFDEKYDENSTYPWDGESVEAVEPDDNGNYALATAANLAWLAEEINNGISFAGKEIVLTNDIDLNGKEWTPIKEEYGTLKNTVIDGNGHTIKNLYSTGHTAAGNDGLGCGFIGMLKSPITIKNITFDNIDVGDKHEYNVVGCILGYTYSTTVFENVNVKNSTIKGYGKAGVFVGMGADPGVSITFRNCSSINNTVKAVYNAGGLAGNILRQNGVDNTVIENCTVSGNQFVKLRDDSAFKALNGEEAAFTVNDLKDGESAPRELYGLYWDNGKYLYAAWGEYYCSYGSSSYDPLVTLSDGTEHKIADSEICVNELPVETAN